MGCNYEVEVEGRGRRKERKGGGKGRGKRESEREANSHFFRSGFCKTKHSSSALFSSLGLLPHFSPCSLPLDVSLLCSSDKREG